MGGQSLVQPQVELLRNYRGGTLAVALFGWEKENTGRAIKNG